MMDLHSETDSICSENSVSMIPKKSGYLLLNPSDPILDNNFDKIIKKRSECSPKWFDLQSIKAIQSDDVFFKFEQTKVNHLKRKNRISLMYDVGNVQLTDEDLELGSNDSNIDGNNDISKQFEHIFGTSIDDSNDESKKKPYLEFDLPIIEQQKRLNEYLLNDCQKELQAKMTLADNVEQQLTLQPLRISRRQRKKLMKENRKKFLAQWYDMPRVEELTKEMEKSLLALKMRRIWNAKQFYKKSSQITATNEMDEQSKYFQIGTIESNATDYYSGRLTNRQRKRTIVDELMSDAELIAFNKRKIQKAMSRNSRLRIMMRRAKLRRLKRKIREKKAPKISFNMQKMIT